MKNAALPGGLVRFSLMASPATSASCSGVSCTQAVVFDCEAFGFLLVSSLAC